MIRDGVQIVFIRWDLRARVVQRDGDGFASDAWGEGSGHVICQVESLEREVDECLELVGEVALGGEPLEVDEQYGW